MAFAYGNRLLLDMNPGASLAYSLRRLSRDYNGPVVTVRRDSDNAEANIGFNGYVLNTDELARFVGAGSGYVKTWYDQSGNGNNLIQTTLLSQPLVYSSGSIITEGVQPAVYFTSSYTMVTTNSLTINQPFSFFRTYKRPNIDGKTTSLISAFGVSVQNVSNGSNRMFAGINISAGVSIPDHQIIYNEFNGASSRTAINSSTDSTGNAGTNNITTGVTINTGREFTLQEFLIYPTGKTNYLDIITFTNYFYQAY